MTAMECPINKRRRISSSTISPPQNIRDFAVEPLAHVASFLPTPSRAMLAIALSSDWADAEWDHENNELISPLQTKGWWIDSRQDSDGDVISWNSEIIAGKCDNLDFGDIEEDLARRLTDDHIDHILLCLDRDHNRIKKFRLTNCTNVTGVGLRRLHGSRTIEQIDLSMVPDHKYPCCWDLGFGHCCRGRLEFCHVVEILDSIVSLQQLNSLKYLHFPLYWRFCPLNPQIDQFLIRYERMWENRTTFCAQCTCAFEPKMCGGGASGNTLFIHMNTCSICMKHYCSDCHDGNGKKLISVCDRCERAHCQDCVKMEDCAACYSWFCRDHCGVYEVWKKKLRQSYKECSGCDRKVCGSCCFERTCSRCHETDCGVCRSQYVPIRRALEEYYEVRKHVEECEICNLTWCRVCKDWEDCDDCDRPIICEECVLERTCHACDRSFCNRCRSISECKRCDKNWCSDCDPSRAWGRDGRGGYCIDCAEALKVGKEDAHT